MRRSGLTNVLALFRRVPPPKETPRVVVLVKAGEFKPSDKRSLPSEPGAAKD